MICGLIIHGYIPGHYCFILLVFVLSFAMSFTSLLSKRFPFHVFLSLFGHQLKVSGYSICKIFHCLAFVGDSPTYSSDLCMTTKWKLNPEMPSDWVTEEGLGAGVVFHQGQHIMSNFSLYIISAWFLNQLDYWGLKNNALLTFHLFGIIYKCIFLMYYLATSLQSSYRS